MWSFVLIALAIVAVIYLALTLLALYWERTDPGWDSYRSGQTIWRREQRTLKNAPAPITSVRDTPPASV